jgi:hypothetical protein
MIKDIKNLTHSITIKFKRNPEKLNKELDKIKLFVQQSKLFNGKRYKLYKFINNNKGKYKK